MNQHRNSSLTMPRYRHTKLYDARDAGRRTAREALPPLSDEQQLELMAEISRLRSMGHDVRIRFRGAQVQVAPSDEGPYREI